MEALPEPFRSYARAVSESTQTPPDMAGAAALSVMSVCVQGRWKIRGKADWMEPLNTFMLGIAPPSERKSAVLRQMARPICEYEAAYNRIHASEVEESRMRKRMLEHRQRAMEEEAAKNRGREEDIAALAREITDFKEVKPLRLFLDDVTPEKLTSTLCDCGGRAAVISGEGGLFNTFAGQYSRSVNIDVLLKGYSGEAIRVDRVGRSSETIDDPALTVLIMMQPEVLEEVIKNPSFRGKGLTARFLYSMPVSKVGSRKFMSSPVPDDVSVKYRRRVCDMLKDSGSGFLVLSREASAAIEHFSGIIEKQLTGELSEIADWSGKLIGNVLRISGLLHMADPASGGGGSVVTGEEMDAAIKLGRYFLSHARRVFRIMPMSAELDKAEKIVKWLAKEKLTRFTRRDVLRNLRSLGTAADIKPVLELLEVYGYIQRDFAADIDPRAHSFTYTVNPHITEPA